ncbi:uncharacterized protein MYCFIDRAFT_83654 [Pseudocercospora fijiensis CIRAD86]|uniref:Uncharacterized protein n=1 Tax=Pseudocercospora fijiensis (strain CIRAD86) TaxID=383855 RepID=M3A5Y0_PSEFD|nr:uncharacterized protein MYCFIDRAFT_83654 [Pseudocercospora fijiensis CIRAD86]EME86529.1 hypothetical protein MYCFIDRAFT_83654 [Pseudocercospora fijiensis CIRAD86]
MLKWKPYLYVVDGCVPFPAVDEDDVVVWLSDATEDATLLGVAASYHGDYVTSTAPDLSGDHPLIRYYTAYQILDHSLGFTSPVGGTQPLIAWDELPSVAQSALANKDWDGPPFRSRAGGAPPEMWQDVIASRRRKAAASASFVSAHDGYTAQAPNAADRYVDEDATDTFSNLQCQNLVVFTRVVVGQAASAYLESVVDIIVDDEADEAYVGD